MDRANAAACRIRCENEISKNVADPQIYDIRYAADQRSEDVAHCLVLCSALAHSQSARRTGRPPPRKSMMSSCVAAAAGKLLSTDAFEDMRLGARQPPSCELVADVEPVMTCMPPMDCAVWMR